jgi:hypothetical protein
MIMSFKFMSRLRFLILSNCPGILELLLLSIKYIILIAIHNIYIYRLYWKRKHWKVIFIIEMNVIFLNNMNKLWFILKCTVLWYTKFIVNMYIEVCTFLAYFLQILAMTEYMIKTEIVQTWSIVIWWTSPSLISCTTPFKWSPPRYTIVTVTLPNTLKLSWYTRTTSPIYKIHNTDSNT